MYNTPQCPRFCSCKPSIPPPAPSLWQFCFYKLASDTGVALPGAEFALKAPDGTVISSVSDSNGLVCFIVVSCNEYILTEVNPPAGYQPIGTPFAVLVDMCGRLFVNGQYTERFVLYNVPQQALLSWYVDYYGGSVSPENLLSRVAMPGVPYGTVITLTPAQLDAFRPPSGYTSGVQVGGPAAIIVDGQVIQVLYEIAPISTVTTGDATDITPLSATIDNNTYSDISDITFVAVQYSTSPTMTAAVAVQGTIGSPFSVDLTGLQQNLTYYYRAVVNTSGGMFYGEIKSFITPSDI